METKVSEIANGIYRLSTFVPEIAPPAGFAFNQFLILGDEPLLFHTGLRKMFPLTRDAVSRIIPPERLRWIAFGHYEADECGAMNEWLAVAPQAQLAHGQTGCLVSLNDMADRPPRLLQDGETIDLGRGKRVRYLDTPHTPARLGCRRDVRGVDRHAAVRRSLHTARRLPAVDRRRHRRARDRRRRPVQIFRPEPGHGHDDPKRSTKLSPRTLALMHGPSFSGDCRSRVERAGGRLRPPRRRSRCCHRQGRVSGRQRDHSSNCFLRHASAALRPSLARMASNSLPTSVSAA